MLICLQGDVQRREAIADQRRSDVDEATLPRRAISADRQDGVASRRREREIVFVVVAALEHDILVFTVPGQVDLDRGDFLPATFKGRHIGVKLRPTVDAHIGLAGVPAQIKKACVAPRKGLQKKRLRFVEELLADQFRRCLFNALDVVGAHALLP